MCSHLFRADLAAFHLLNKVGYEVLSTRLTRKSPVYGI
jgi:hypothetical protein